MFLSKKLSLHDLLILTQVYKWAPVWQRTKDSLTANSINNLYDFKLRLYYNLGVNFNTQRQSAYAYVQKR